MGDYRAALLLITVSLLTAHCLLLTPPLPLKRQPSMNQRPVALRLSGLIYGAIIYLIMNFLVLPLSGVPHPKSTITLANRINGVLALLFCIGLPVSLLISRKRRAEDATEKR